MPNRVLIVLASACATAAVAQPVNENTPARTIQCIEANGQSVPARCRASASRLDQRQDICTCPSGGQRVEVATCAKGEDPPPQGLALNVARHEASRDGSLIGDTVDGRPICVAPRQP